MRFSRKGGKAVAIAVAVTAAVSNVAAQLPADARSVLPERWKNYFAMEARALADANAPGALLPLEEWSKAVPRLRGELRYMLGLDPAPDRGDLHAVVVGSVEREGVVAERIHFQPVPRFYAAANLYRPAKVSGRMPAVLYVCGHKNMEKKGVRYGNKTGYHHHGVWFARNGYVCMVVDTYELGEIGGDHHGTHCGLKNGQARWWWNSRGFTPAGVEAWTGIRAVDYLCGRPEVDARRIGMTGRSGGGCYSWLVPALDERVGVLAPAAGITDVINHVTDGAVDGHCDCMYYVNCFRWDFWKLAALPAPRHTLLINTDSDRIFPLDGVMRLHGATRTIHSLHATADTLGLAILPGKHSDTQDQQVAAFRWMNLWLKGGDPPVAPASELFTPRELKVFDTVPADEINTTIDEHFVPRAPAPAVPGTPAQWRTMRSGWMELLRTRCFSGWPAETTGPMHLRRVDKGRTTTGEWAFESQPGVGLALRLALPEGKGKRPERCVLRVVEEAEATGTLRAADGDAVAEFVARPLGRLSARDEVRVRRRFMVLGQTLDGMRVYDIRMAMRALRGMEPVRGLPLCIEARGNAAVNALYASLFEEAPERMVLTDAPPTHMAGPDYLNVLRVLDVPQAAAMAAERGDVTLCVREPAKWRYVRDTAAALAWKSPVIERLP